MGGDVNPFRPLFTGDIYTSIDIPGLGESLAIVIGHPCSFRGRNGRLNQRTPVASIEAHEKVSAPRWAKGFFNRMPLAGLPLDNMFHVARLDRFGLALTSEILETTRIACLSHTGINQLQQRLVFHQTRLVVPTAKFHEAFDHTYEEADLLEEWCTDLESTGPGTVSGFEAWIRGGRPSRQELLRQPQQRAQVRREMRDAITQEHAERAGDGMVPTPRPGVLSPNMAPSEPFSAHSQRRDSSGE